MRCFIAVDLPKDIKTHIHAMQNEFKIFENLDIVNTKQLHSTLIFLGDMDNSKIEKTKDILAKVVGFHGPTKCRLGDLGVFPNSDYIRVLWVAIIDDGALSKLQNDLQFNLRKHGIYESDKPFMAHMTIARVRNSKNKHAILSILEKNKDFKTGYFEIDEIKLKESILSPGGPVYHDIAVYKLRESA
ncbi:MAG: RNA 2',3'-cyclic phosphodiesterase [archaeon]